MNKVNEQEDLLSKLASRAKRKLNKSVQVGEEHSLSCDYEFVKTNIGEQDLKLEKKIVQILRVCPDCDDPIGKLIDHSIYDKLNEERKQAYIFKLSNNYAKICGRLKK